MAKQRTKTASTASGDQHPSLLARFVGLVLLSVFMFTVGVFVGRGTAPVQFDVPGIQERLKRLREMAYKEETARYHIEGEDAAQRRPLKYREVLPQPEAPAESAPAPKRTAPVKRPSPAEAPTAPSPRQSADGGTAGDGVYVLQVASMKDGAAAAEMVGRLKEKGFPAYREAIEITDKGRWYRVRIGAYPDRPSVEKARAALGAVADKSMIVRTSGE